METYLYRGIRIPKGFKIAEVGHFFSPLCYDYLTKTLHIDLNFLRLHKHIMYMEIAHEAMHARLYEKGFRSDSPLNRVRHEVYAMTYSAHLAMKRKSKRAVKKWIQMVNKCHNMEIGHSDHRKAADVIMKSNLWKRCNNFINS